MLGIEGLNGEISSAGEIRQWAGCRRALRIPGRRTRSHFQEVGNHRLGVRVAMVNQYRAVQDPVQAGSIPVRGSLADDDGYPLGVHFGDSRFMAFADMAAPGEGTN